MSEDDVACTTEDGRAYKLHHGPSEIMPGI